jgi:DUF4097 and DUF4098 domain-containing protein YvlB
MRRLLVVLCVACLSLAADSRYHEDFHYSYAQSPGGRLSVENFNGSVEISGWDQNSVDVSGTKYADSETRLHDVRIDISNQSNGVQIRTLRPDRDHRGHTGAKYVIWVPRQTELERIHSSNGTMRVETIDGNMTLDTSNGSVHLSDIHGNVDANSSNGSVEVRKVEGRMSFETSNGSVRAENVHGGIHAHTSNGSVDLEFETPQIGDLTASTSNGGITVHLPASTNATISAHTSGHDRIYSDFDVTVRGSLSASRLEGTLGGGGPRIELSTSNGNIRLARSTL